LSGQDIFHITIRQNFYRDSLQLLKISDSIRRVSREILEASIIMATPTNKEILIRLGFRPSSVGEAQESDIIIAIRARDQKSVDLAVAEADRLLESPAGASKQDESKVDDLESALRSMPDANLALLSIPGDHVREVSLKLIDLGINQQIFSDHVPVEDELEIKTLAAEMGVLILGPGAGTSIMNGKGIGFSNAVRTGPVGIVAAAGTGLQEVATLLDHCGIGVKHGLGVGGNDPKDKIGGIMMMQCIKMLESNPDVGIIGIVSKPPSPSVQEKIVSYLTRSAGKKYVLAFIGGAGGDQKNGGRIVQVNTLASAVLAIAKQLGRRQFEMAIAATYVPPKDLMPSLEDEWRRLGPGQKRVRALYTGGTFTYEAEVILGSILADEPIYSNSPILNIKQLDDSFKSQDTSIVDLGEEEFTEGRPHPMIDPTVRKFRIAEEASDPSVAVLLMDFVLGYGSHPDPVGAVINEIDDAKRMAGKAGRHLCVVAHVCGTSDDLQGYSQSIDKLKGVGCVVLPTNALAAVASAAVARRGKVDIDGIYAQYLTAGEAIE